MKVSELTKTSETSFWRQTQAEAKEKLTAGSVYENLD